MQWGPVQGHGRSLASVEATPVAGASARRFRPMVKRSGWEGGSVIRNLFGGLVLACTCLTALAGGASIDKPKISSMRFEWRVEQPADLCGNMCRMWISA